MSIIPTKTVEFVEIEMGIFDETVNEGKIRGETDAGAGSPYGEGPILLKEISPEHDAGSDGGKTEAPGGGEA